MSTNNSKSELTSFQAENGQFAVMLPCSPEAFGEFVSGLLGKPQTIEKQIFGAFEVNREAVENIYHLVHQRVTQQNAGTLIQFVATIVYDDNSSVRVNSFEDFVGYSEIGTKISRAINLSWVYLINFPQKSSPEKQEINISFRVSMFGMMGGRSIYNSYFFGEGTGFTIRINHTVRSWGVDMEALLSGHLASIKKTDVGRLRKLFFRYDDAFLAATFVASFMASLSGFIWVLTISAGSRLSEVMRQLSGSDVQIAANASKLAVFELVSGKVPNSIVYSMLFLLFMAAISLLFSVFVTSLVKRLPQGALLLTTHAVDELAKRRKSEAKAPWKLFSSFVVTVSIGVISNFAYQHLVGLLEQGV